MSDPEGYVWLMLACVVPTLEATSTPPWGDQAGGAFVNLACRARTSYEAREKASASLRRQSLLVHHFDSVTKESAKSKLGEEGYRLVLRGISSDDVQMGDFYTFPEKL